MTVNKCSATLLIYSVFHYITMSDLLHFLTPNTQKYKHKWTNPSGEGSGRSWPARYSLWRAGVNHDRRKFLYFLLSVCLFQSVPSCKEPEDTTDEWAVSRNLSQ